MALFLHPFYMRYVVKPSEIKTYENAGSFFFTTKVSAL